MGQIDLAIIGVGHCAWSLVQGVHKYANATYDQTFPGLTHPIVGEYGIGDNNFVAALDIDANKVGLDLSKAIFAEPNKTIKFQDVPNLGIPVQRGMTHDGIGKYMSSVITKAPGPTDDVAGLLREREVDMVVYYLPVGSEEATTW